jgi:hypothetical protein
MSGNFYNEMEFAEQTYEGKLDDLRASYGLRPIDRREFTGSAIPEGRSNWVAVLIHAMSRR